MSGTVDRLALMQTFVRVVDAGSLSAAAVQLGTSQPTISRRLLALERALGFPLLQRTTHAMNLTDAGARYLSRARELITEWEQFESELRGADDVPEGTLRVVVPHAYGQLQLVLPLIEYMKRYPSLTVEWELRDEDVRMVEERIDCVIRVGQIREESVVARKMFEVRRIIVGSPELVGRKPSVARVSDLKGIPWLALGQFYRNTLRLTSDRGAETTLRIKPRFVTDSIFALRTAALGGLGITVISRWSIAEDLEQGRLIQLLPRYQAEPLPVYILYPHARFYPAKLRKFVEVMRTAFDAEFAARKR